VILSEGPWAFDGHLLILKEGTWVKAYDVLAVQQTSAFAKFSVAKVGDFVSCHEEEDMLGADKALCFRVDVKEGVTVKVDGKSIWIIRFKYLKLPDFCYGCGFLGHTLKSCKDCDPDTYFGG